MQLLIVFFGLDAWNLKDLRFMHASEWNSFKTHRCIQLNNSHYSYSFHMKNFRDTTCAAGNVTCRAPKIDRYFESNLPMNKIGFIDVFGEQRVLFEKIQGNFIENVDAMARRKLGLKYWSDQPIGKMLSVAA